MLDVEISSDDDAGFMARVAPLVIGSVAVSTPEQVWIVRIDDWFDLKWLRYKGMHLQTARWDPPDQPWVSLPPFMPTRVIKETLFRRDSLTGRYQCVQPDVALRSPRGSDRDKDTLRREGPRSVVLGWFSGATAMSGQGSLMVYDLTAQGLPSRWYASFRRNADWSQTKTVEISNHELAYLERRGRELAAEHR